MVVTARQHAEALIQGDPDLTKDEHRPLAAVLRGRFAPARAARSRLAHRLQRLLDGATVKALDDRAGDICDRHAAGLHARLLEFGGDLGAGAGVVLDIFAGEGDALNREPFLGKYVQGPHHVVE